MIYFDYLGRQICWCFSNSCNWHQSW